MDKKINILSGLMINNGAKRIIIKRLSNNDNSKQQIYFGSDFSVIKSLPIGNIISCGMSKKGAIFKASINWFWLSFEGDKEQAHGAQVILYPKYPEVRLSGLIKGCAIAPSHLLQPPTKKEREDRLESNRYLIMGISEEAVFSYISSWDDELSCELESLIENKEIHPVFSVFYEYYYELKNSKETLLRKLKDIHSLGFVPSQRLNKNGELIAYKAKNGAGFTLESLFNIKPNGSSEPDFMGWELKAHSGSVVTLMTPEPDTGLYVADIHDFMNSYSSSQKPERVDFASIHKMSIYNEKTGLTLNLEGYDFSKQEIVNPEGGLFLRDSNGKIAAGWSFSKILDHWKRKHSKTCFVHYSVRKSEHPSYLFGPKITLADGSDIKKFMSALSASKIYYDPGVNIKYHNGKAKPKKRNQFRMKWNDVGEVYDHIVNVTISDI
ncbi:MvaI/BcnI family restriction endonuclease [Dickeya solani]|uniref:MvaI/BcnI family restriction endonuclease n=1 Tax=Dickeya solani TaxID=1089444 RepID=A0AAX4F5C1_9GAMM|nr:MvaI/BcnI family restriction endonuclease [Dickeya solani]WOA54194.1 MvaI/BcnI family restriction endonuclease [Dickeya solani]